MNQTYWKLLTYLAEIMTTIFSEEKLDTESLCTRSELLSYIMTCVDKMGIADFAFQLGGVTALVMSENVSEEYHQEVYQSLEQLMHDLGLQDEIVFRGGIKS